MKNKSVFVKAKFKPVGKYEKVNIPTGETKKGLFGGEKEVTRSEKQWVQTGFSDCEIDGDQLQIDIQYAIEQLNKEGYEVITTTAITSGRYNYRYDTEYVGKSYGYGYGYGITEGVLILARQIS